MPLRFPPSMSSRPRFNAQGGRHGWRRDFCNRPPPPYSAAFDGDSHLRPVGEANHGFRPGPRGYGGWSHRPASQPMVPGTVDHYNHRPNGPRMNFFGPRMPVRSDGSAGQSSRGGYPSRPPKLEDHRNWSFAVLQPPPQSERFVVVSYNILADYLAMEHRSKLYYHIPPYFLDWEWRKNRLLLEFRLWAPDIMCLQEVDKFHDLEEQLASQGYSGIWKMRTGNAVDGCAVFWKKSRFQLRYEENMEFNKLGMRDNVAQICVLESTIQSSVRSESASSPGSSDQLKQANQVVICNIHVLYNPKRGEIKIGQVRTLINRAHAVSKIWNDAPVIICGDFNCTPKSSLYNFIASRTVNLSGLARDQVSGQYSTPRPYVNSAINRNAMPINPIGQHGTGTLSCQLQNDVKDKNYTECSSDVGKGKNVDVPDSSFGSQVMKNTTLPATTAHRIVERGSLSDKSVEVQGYFAGQCNQDAYPSASKSVPELSNSSGNVAHGVNNETIESLSSEISKPFPQVTDLSTEVENNLAAPTKDFQEDLSFSNLQLNDEESCSFPSVIKTRDFTIDVPETSFVTNNTTGKYEAGEVYSDDCISKSGPYISVSTVVDSSNSASILTAEESSSTFPLCTNSTNEGLLTDDCDISGTEQSSLLTRKPTTAGCTFPSSDSENWESIKDCESMYINTCSLEENADPNFLKELLGQEGSPDFCDNMLSSTTSVNNVAELDAASIESQGSTSGADWKKFFYNPYLWTPSEIEVASGSEDCTLVEHSLELRSVYTDVPDTAGTRDPNNEPEVTSYNRQFMGTVDYIWSSEGLQTVKVLETIPKHILQKTRGFPTKRWGSDHLALACQLAFTEKSKA